MANAFNKEERIAFENILEGFQDALVLSKTVSVYSTDSTEMERASNIIWRPQPYVAQSFNGTDMTANFKDFIQLAVPATLGFNKSVPWAMTATELRDALQEQRLGEAAKQKLASDINVAVNTIAAQQGSLVVKRTVAATGFDDVALCDSIMNEQGVQAFDRYLALSSRDSPIIAGPFRRSVRRRSSLARHWQRGPILSVSKRHAICSTCRIACRRFASSRLPARSKQVSPGRSPSCLPASTPNRLARPQSPRFTARSRSMAAMSRSRCCVRAFGPGWHAISRPTNGRLPISRRWAVRRSGCVRAR